MRSDNTFDYGNTEDLTEWADDMAASYQPNGIPCGAGELVYRAVAIKLRRLAELEAGQPKMTTTAGTGYEVFVPSVWIAPTSQ